MEKTLSGSVSGSVSGGLTGIEARSKKKMVQRKEESRFIVKTNKGYVESFDNLASARGQYDILKKKAMKQKESIKMEIIEQNSKGQKIVDQVNVAERFYE